MSTQHHQPAPRSAGGGVEPELARQSHRFGIAGGWFLLGGLVPAVPGILLIVLTGGWAYDLGWVLVAIGLVPAAMSAGLLLTSAFANWTAHRRPFA